MHSVAGACCRVRTSMDSHGPVHGRGQGRGVKAKQREHQSRGSYAGRDAQDNYQGGACASPDAKAGSMISFPQG